jgi:hypothetical protein
MRAFTCSSFAQSRLEPNRGRTIASSVKIFLAALSFLVAMTSVAAAQSEGSGRALVVLNVLRLSADTERTGLGVVKQFRIPHPGVVRLRYAFKSDGDGSVTVLVASAINDNNLCNASTTSTTFQAKVCDVKVVAGDLIRVAANGSLDPFTFVQTDVTLKNVRLFWNVVNATSSGSMVAD